MRLLGICIALISSLYANIVRCVNLDDYQGWIDQDGLEFVQNRLINELTPVVEKNCLSEAGMGAKSTCRGRWVNTCSGESDSKNGYLKIEMSCDFCQGAKLKNELDMFVEQCKVICRNTNRLCLGDESGWGGAIILMPGQINDCGSPLPNCSVSSSSETIESSSSEELSSSSEYIESSSSVVNSSSSENVDSSSGEDDGDDDESSSSSGDEECGTGTGHCPVSSSSFNGGLYGYVEDLEPCDEINEYMILAGFDYTWKMAEHTYVAINPRKFKIPRFTKKPGFYGELKSNVGCDYLNEAFFVNTNIPYVYFESSPHVYCCLHSSPCNRMGDVPRTNIQGFYICQDYNREYTDEYVTHDPNQGCRIVSEHGENYGIRFELAMTRSILDADLSLQKTDTALKEIEAFFPSNYTLQQLLGEQRIVDDFEKCKVRIREYHHYELLSSSSTQSSSSSEESSSSSQEESSSSSEESSSSSSQAESSSSENVYSSSGEDTFVAGADQEYSPDQIFRGGLDNMEPGSCYSLNPDRGPQHGWINTNAQDSWWWREVDCESGEKVDRGRIGACPGFPLDKVPSNPKRTCVAYNGKCYRCKSENSYVDCSQEWLWKWSFNVQNIGTWYAEVDCYNPFDEEDCPDNALYKNGNFRLDTDKFEYKQYHNAHFGRKIKYFNPLGKMSNYFSKINRAVYYKKNIVNRNIKTEYQNEVDFNLLSILNTEITYLCSYSHDKWKCVRNSEIISLKKNGIDENGCGILGYDYGIIEKGVKIGGITCATVEVKVVDVEILKQNIVGKCRDGSRKMDVSINVKTESSLIRNEPYWVRKGYKFPDNSVATEEDEHAMRQHEYGHKYFNSCLSLPNGMLKVDFDCICESQLEIKFGKERDRIVNTIAQKSGTLLDKQGDLFHSIYGRSGYAESYSCPSK